jgi:hypothetical protein
MICTAGAERPLRRLQAVGEGARAWKVVKKASVKVLKLCLCTPQGALGPRARHVGRLHQPRTPSYREMKSHLAT